MGAEDADRTLFVGNLHPKATEELLFELFLQAGPAVNVKIPKDKDGKPKMFAFVNFKHEESVPYGMHLLNGIKLFGRPLKIQYRSGSIHMSQDANATQTPQGNMIAGNSPSSNGGRQEGNNDPMKYNDQSPFPGYQRSYSSPDNLQRQAMMNSFYQQESPYGSRDYAMPQPSSPTLSSNFPQSGGWHNQNYDPPSQHRYDSPPSHRHARSQASHPYKNESYHNRDVYRSGQEEQYHQNRHYDHSHSRKESRWGHSYR